MCTKARRCSRSPTWPRLGPGPGLRAPAGPVHEGQTVEATVEAFPGQIFRGKVEFIDPHSIPATRTVDVRYDLDNPDLSFGPACSRP